MTRDEEQDDATDKDGDDAENHGAESAHCIEVRRKSGLLAPCMESAIVFGYHGPPKSFSLNQKSLKQLESNSRLGSGLLFL